MISSHDAERFAACCQRALTSEHPRCGIGTLGERTLHRILKDFFEPDSAFHEQKIGRYIADIQKGKQIIEIQTRGFSALRGKLQAFTPDYSVQIVYPIAKTKYLTWVDPDTGALSARRRSPKRGEAWDFLYELYALRPLMPLENVAFTLIFLDIEEFRLKNGWGKDHKRGAIRWERIPTALQEILTLRTPSDYLALMPELPGRFTTADFARAAKMTRTTASKAVQTLLSVGVIEKIAKQGNAYLYQKKEAFRTRNAMVMKMFHEHECYTAPIWNGGVIVGETILPLYAPDKEGELSIPLMNPIARVLEVRRADRSEIFEAGRDYSVQNGELVIPIGSHISVMPWSEYNPATPTDAHAFLCTTGGYLRFGEANSFHKLQYEVTYESASNSFDGRYVPTVSPFLSHTRQKLENGVLRLAFFGDSITYGANASGLGAGVAPNMPIYPKLVAETLERRGRKIHYYNPSIGGKTSAWGAQVASQTVGAFAPDLCVVAFGMNDGNGTQNPERRIADFLAHIQAILCAVREKNPSAEFILVCPSFPNPLAAQFIGLQQAFEKPLLALAEKEHCAALNITDIQRTLMTRKAYHHFTGNNINHPSDFFARIHAQGILAVMGEA